MKRYLFVLLSVAYICCILPSCEKKDKELTPAGILIEWVPADGNVLFADGCRVDEYSVTYDGESIVFDDCDVILYTRNDLNEYLFLADLECKISHDSTEVLDIIMHDTWVDLLGPDGKGYFETFIYFRGGFWAFLTSHSGGNGMAATTPEFRYNGVEYPVSSFIVSGVWHNNREWRCKSDGSSWEYITKKLEYTDCDVTIELEVDGKPLILNITHISPL